MAHTPYETSPNRNATYPLVDSDFADITVVATSSSPWGLTSEAQMQALVDQVASLVTAMKTAGLIAAS